MGSWHIWLISHLPEALQQLKEGSLGAELPPSCNTKQFMTRAADVPAGVQEEVQQLRGIKLPPCYVPSNVTHIIRHDCHACSQYQ